MCILGVSIQLTFIYCKQHYKNPKNKIKIKTRINIESNTTKEQVNSKVNTRCKLYLFSLDHPWNQEEHQWMLSSQYPPCHHILQPIKTY